MAARDTAKSDCKGSTPECLNDLDGHTASQGKFIIVSPKTREKRKRRKGSELDSPRGKVLSVVKVHGGKLILALINGGSE